MLTEDDQLAIRLLACSDLMPANREWIKLTHNRFLTEWKTPKFRSELNRLYGTINFFFECGSG
jgi:hypothetical protein